MNQYKDPPVQKDVTLQAEYIEAAKHLGDVAINYHNQCNGKNLDRIIREVAVHIAYEVLSKPRHYSRNLGVSPIDFLNDTVHFWDMDQHVTLTRNEFYTVSLNDQLVPHLSAYPEMNTQQDGNIESTDYDRVTVFAGPVGMSYPKETLPMNIRTLAYAMAVAAGYTSFGEHSKSYNPYKKKS